MAEQILKDDSVKKECSRKNCSNPPGCFNYRRKMHHRERSLYHIMRCPPTKQQPKPKTVKVDPPAPASPAPTSNTIRMGGFTVTPEEFPTAQLADYQWLKATEKVVPLDWSSISRYISVVGTG